MPTELVWLEQARIDVANLLDHLAKQSPRAAQDYVDGLFRASGRLENFPLSGRRYDDTYRVIVYRNHLLFYAFDEIEDRVSITMVIDGRRDLQRLLEDG